MQIIQLTPAAIEAIESFKNTLQVPDGYYLRVGIRQKNAQEKGLIIGFDEKNDKDKTTEVAGINIIYHPGQALFFAGMKIDFTERNGKRGFVLLESK